MKRYESKTGETAEEKAAEERERISPRPDLPKYSRLSLSFSRVPGVLQHVHNGSADLHPRQNVADDRQRPLLRRPAQQQLERKEIAQNDQAVDAGRAGSEDDLVPLPGTDDLAGWDESVSEKETWISKMRTR